MAFLFKSKKAPPTSALPPATREITSSHGPPSNIPAPNGMRAREGDAPKEAPSGKPAQTPTPGSSVNNSLNSLQDVSNGSPDQREARARADSEPYNARAAQGHSPRGLSDSPYPWSQRRLAFGTPANPFPRYGSAVNSVASKDGSIYMMGGLVNGQTVKGDLWMVEAGNGSMACFPVATTSEGPGPRVGHASLLVGNAFIVFGGDTKQDDGDVLDDTLYLLNTSTKQWSRALPAGPRPAGRYGHTLNILGSKIYIFGGQVEGYFFNDLVAFDLNALQVPNNRWEVLVPNSIDVGAPPGQFPPARTNHSVVSWNDKLYLFGGTDGLTWFSDVWCYDPRTNVWTELDCIGYIPLAREGHAAAIVNDTMYIFGGRTREGTDLGDLAAFRITSRRWYMFQNMGPSPSPRSGHSMTAFGKHVVVLAGEPSSSAPDRNELSLAYVLDTSKIRYPASEQASQAIGADRAPTNRKMSGGERTGIPQSKGAARESVMGGLPLQRPIDPPPLNGAPPPNAPPPNAPPPNAPPPNAPPPNAPGGPGSRLPRATAGSVSSGSGPPPQQQPPQPRTNGVMPGPGPYGARSKTPPEGMKRGHGPPVDTARAAAFDRENMSPVSRNSPQTREMDPQPMQPLREQSPAPQTRMPPHQKSSSLPREIAEHTRMGSNPSRSGSRSAASGKGSLDKIEHSVSRPSQEAPRSASREATDRMPVDSGLGSSPALTQQNDELVREVEAARNRNAWLASELALARKAGYQPNASSSPVLDEKAADAFADDDRPLIEALIKMRSELARIQGSIDAQAEAAANKIAEVERQRDAAIGEAVYAKTKLAAHGGSQAGTPQPDGRSTGTPELDRMADMNRRLASSLAAQSELSSRVDSLLIEMESEKRARQLAEETAEAAQKRASELDAHRQRNMMEVESLRAELHEAEKAAREESANAAEARASVQLLTIDKTELSSKLARALEDAKNHSTVLQTLRDAVAASTEKASHFETKLEEERALRTALEEQLAQLKAEHEDRSRELDSTSRKLRDVEDLAEKHAAEAKMHREAVLSGLSRVADESDNGNEVSDERVTILQQQVESANAMVRRNQEAADVASEKLRRAEERIAGLETFQEQASRESLTIRKQLQSAMRELQTLQTEKAEVQQKFERYQLESNALEVQLKTLKNLLDERGMGAAERRRSRALDSPGSRFSTPELSRVHELERQLEDSRQAHDDMRTSFEQREHDISRDWEGKISALHNDHQAAVKYLRGTEKMLSKMKQELERYKTTNTELEAQLLEVKTKGDVGPQIPAGWEIERQTLQTELQKHQDTLESFESQIAGLQSDLAATRQDREAAAQHTKELEDAAQQTRADMETLKSEKAMLEERARDAEHRVQLFLDQFENSVDNYRRQSQMMVPGGGAGGHRRHQSQNSIAGESVYSEGDAETGGSATPDANASAANAAATRNSMALDSLATELDALRSHWETTNRAYRLSNNYDLERTPTSASTDKGEMDESLAQWRKRLDVDDDAHGELKQEDRSVTSPSA
ncbi:hypothetical protein K490DRAFT_62943 [Saccharata proteae CBS 121410]|uniref:Cell polarity protein-like protein n=1 Tax=Saccharata proteae CBS 121410 TaxID=1314787 RepID=A0A9P4LYM8_9PEZI|nr:hypothetical protein K490DRAFT_62943 [Saccharata proteae CBS 121410]